GMSDTDVSSDTYDTIDWLVKNIPYNNGRVGLWGISYPGFQAAMGIIDAHPALKAASPQAPMADVFVGDDFHHNGAFFLAHAFAWLWGTAPARSNREAIRARFVPPDLGTPDSYEFFVNVGPLPNVNTKYFKDQVPIWNEFMQHGAYDNYWKSRNVIPHLKNIKPAVMTVAGWFDSEDKYGAVNIYHKIEKENPDIKNIIVWGPWFHGGWARVDGDTLGNIRFGSKTSLWYRENVELPFFNYYLKDKGELTLPEVTAFMTGANEWKSYDQWPPKEGTPTNLYLLVNGKLSFSPPMEKSANAFDSYVSDPSKPVPFTAQTTTFMGHLFMVEDQRFAWSRPDVLVYQSDVLPENVTIAGPVGVTLYASTTGTDCDWVVKLIDVYPGNAPDSVPNPGGVKMGGFQMMLAADVMRSKFRNSIEKPEPMVPKKTTKIEFELPDKLHRFLKGHKIMVQIQSTWFPLVDRNPGKFVDIYNAKETDFQKTTQRVYRSGKLSSHLRLNVLR
ncbi:MAG: CocE/NonD family hydrolase, partial [Bacteroidota bacterium]